MNGKDLEIIHLKKMLKPLNMLINKGNMSIFHFSKISSFLKNQAIMSTNRGGYSKIGAFLLKSFKYHTPWRAKKTPNHTLWPKLSYTLETVSPEKHPHNKISAKLIRVNKKSVKRSISPTSQQSKKNKEKKKMHLKRRWPSTQSRLVFDEI
jgi:hypothetical protein